MKIGDFGISKRAKHDVTLLRTRTGTPLYEAPEISGDVLIEDEDELDGYTNAVDMWSLGCMVYEMAAATKLFPNHPRDYKKLCWGKWYPDRPPKLSQQGWDFIRQLLVPNPSGRLSAEDAILHKWIQHDVASEAVEGDFELTVRPSHLQDRQGNTVTGERSTEGSDLDSEDPGRSVFDDPARTIKARTTVIIVVSSESSHQSSNDPSTTHAVSFSHSS